MRLSGRHLPAVALDRHPAVLLVESALRGAFPRMAAA